MRELRKMKVLVRWRDETTEIKRRRSEGRETWYVRVRSCWSKKLNMKSIDFEPFLFTLMEKWQILTNGLMHGHLNVRNRKKYLSRNFFGLISFVWIIHSPGFVFILQLNLGDIIYVLISIFPFICNNINYKVIIFLYSITSFMGAKQIIFI